METQPLRADAEIDLSKQSLAKQPVIVACTAWGQPEDRRKSREAGFNHHLVKPVDINALEKLLIGRISKVDHRGIEKTDSQKAARRNS